MTEAPVDIRPQPPSDSYTEHLAKLFRIPDPQKQWDNKHVIIDLSN